MVEASARATVGCMHDSPRDFSQASSPLLFRWARWAITTTMVVLLAFVAGCDRNIEPYQPGEEPSPPDLARIFPGPTGGGSTADLSENSRAPDRSALPPSRAEGSEVASASMSASPAAPIEGTIELAAGVDAASFPGGAVLFVIARPQGVLRGPPLAVLRVSEAVFPYSFRIGPENVMIPSMKFEGAISLSARLDADGNAMTRGAGDISSETLEPLAPGATGVALVLGERG